jgi:hypothetical protein
MKAAKSGNGTVTIPREGDIGKRWYSDDVEGLERALVDSITAWIGDKTYKSPATDPNDPDGVLVNYITPPVYAGYIPSSLLSPDGLLDPPSAPSVLVEGVSGKLELGSKEGEYEIAVKIVVTLWDDAPDFSGYSDAKYLKEMIYFKLLQFRLLQEKYEMTGTTEWKNVASGHNNYFVTTIEMSYKMGPPPDSSSSVDADIRDNNFLFDGALVVRSTPGTDLVITDDDRA